VDKLVEKVIGGEVGYFGVGAGRKRPRRTRREDAKKSREEEEWGEVEGD
jgi:hypothetical protein